MLWQPALAAFVISLICVKASISGTARRPVLDHPNERMLHERPAPRAGGLVIAAGVGVAWLVGAPGLAVTLSLATALAAGMAVFGFGAYAAAVLQNRARLELYPAKGQLPRNTENAG